MLSLKVKKRCVSLWLVIAVMLTPLVMCRPSRTKRDNDETVHTDGGAVEGGVYQGAVEFLGVPYVQPPTGHRRWKPPEPCTWNSPCWSGVLDAYTKYGDYCAQPNGNGGTYGKEDCLFLNVWTPKLDNAKRPVLVYIHGNELMYGSGTDGGEHPTPELVLEMDIVGVSFNYRLNTFGFMALSALTHDSETGTSGNYGLMDQVLALRWVKNNIEKFGGDPNRVTIMGHSSGGTSALALLTSPLAEGLFHGAILMSASAVFDKSRMDAEKDNEPYLESTQCDSGTLAQKRDCLYSKSIETLIESIPFKTKPHWGMYDLTKLPEKDFFNGALAIVDGHVLPNPPLKALEQKLHLNDVPVIIGSTAQEIDFQPGNDFTGRPIADVYQHVRSKLNTFLSSTEIDHVFAMYEQYQADPQLFYSTIVSDIRANCPNEVLAAKASLGLTSSVYRYELTDWPSNPVKLPVPYAKASPFAFHVWDIQAFFGFPSELGYVPSEQDRVLQRELRREFGSFIHTGRVSTSSWTKYPHSTGLFTGSGLRVSLDKYHQQQCDFWKQSWFLPIRMDQLI